MVGHKRGPARLPLDVLIARGSQHARGRTQEVAQPAPEKRVMPTKPDWLTVAASKFWDKAVPKLLPLGLLGAADDDTIGRYCQAFVDWVILGNKLRVVGHTVQTEKGVASNPDSLAHNRIALQLASLEDKLGLTPAARLKMHISILPPSSTAKSGRLDRSAPLGGEEFFKQA